MTTHPSTSHFLLSVGRQSKDTVRCELFPWKTLQKLQRNDIASLRVEKQSLQSPHPLCFAESDSSRTDAAHEDATAPCHETSVFPCQLQSTITQSLFGIVHARSSASWPMYSVHLSMTSLVSKISSSSYGHGLPLGELRYKVLWCGRGQF